MNDTDPASPPAPAPEPPPDSAAAAADVKPKRKSPEKPAKRKGFYGFALDWFEQFGQHLPKHLHQMAMWLGGRWWFHDQPKRLLMLAFRGAGKSTLVGLFAAWIIRSSSMMWWSTGIDRDWSTNTSAPRTFCSIRTRVS